MAKTLWADVLFDGEACGLLQEEPGGRVSFRYHSAWVEAGRPALAHTLPLRLEAYTPAHGLPPYFDNLVAEGWLAEAQAKALGTTRDNRLALLIGFGLDCIGAVTIVDPDPAAQHINLAWGDPDQMMALASRASLSGVQPKMTVVRERKGYRPAVVGEVSTHIAKLPSPALPDLLENELLTLTAGRTLLKGDTFVEAELSTIGAEALPALIVRRFDRHVPYLDEGGAGDGSGYGGGSACGAGWGNGSGDDVYRHVAKIHFEEFNQLLGRYSSQKYDAGYEVMPTFMRQSGRCLPVEIDRLLRRVLACILVGNTDAHLKNFALFHETSGYRLTPCYDWVAAAAYKPYQTLALSIAEARDLRISALKPNNLLALTQGFGLSKAALRLAVEDLGKMLPKAKEAVFACSHGSNGLKDKLIELMEKRWNGTFAPLGSYLGRKS